VILGLLVAGLEIVLWRQGRLAHPRPWAALYLTLAVAFALWWLAVPKWPRETPLEPLAQARNLRIDLKAARDEALKELRQRLIGLRGELDQILEDDDGRWYDFGFYRPADGKQPSPVAGLVLTPGGAGIVLASWAASSLAVNYRVTWKPTSSSGEPTEVGLVGETQFALTSLPSGVPITIGVSARNDSGETAPTEAAIVVP